MSLHGLLSVTIGVPNVEETAAYYAEFGLTPQPAGWFSTVDAGIPAGRPGAPPQARSRRPGQHRLPRHHGVLRRRAPEDLEGARGLFAWGPPPPPSFMHPEDLAAMMTGAHSAR
jgi:hypothetical protein